MRLGPTRRPPSPCWRRRDLTGIARAGERREPRVLPCGHGRTEQVVGRLRMWGHPLRIGGRATRFAQLPLPRLSSMERRGLSLGIRRSRDRADDHGRTALARHHRRRRLHGTTRLLRYVRNAPIYRKHSQSRSAQCARGDARRCELVQACPRHFREERAAVGPARSDDPQVRHVASGSPLSSPLPACAGTASDRPPV